MAIIDLLSILPSLIPINRGFKVLRVFRIVRTLKVFRSFNNFFEAIYWATVSLTTVGYGDLYPVTTIGRVITMVSSIFGVAVIALPAGIITAGYMKEVENERIEKQQTNDEIEKV